jgi:hypothetical protein
MPVCLLFFPLQYTYILSAINRGSNRYVQIPEYKVNNKDALAASWHAAAEPPRWALGNTLIDLVSLSEISLERLLNCRLLF